MQWFKRLYHEKFANHSNNDQLQKTIDVNECQHQIPIEPIQATISNAIDCDNSVDRCYQSECRNYHLLSQNTEGGARVKIETISENNCDSNDNDDDDNENNANNKKEIVVVDRMKKVQVPDKNTYKTEQLITTDINETCIDSHLASHSKYEQCESATTLVVSCNSDVNEYGNGENDCDTVSKSTDPRLQRTTKTTKIIIVPTANSNNFIHSSIAFGLPTINPSQRPFYQTNSNGYSSSDSDEQRLVHQTNHQQRELSQRFVARELEYFITSVDTQANSDFENNSNRSRRDHRDDCNNNSNNSNETLNDWVVVSIELNRFASYDSSTDDEQQFGFIESLSTPRHHQYYSTSEFSDLDNRTIITFHQYPSIGALNEEVPEYEYPSQEQQQQYLNNRGQDYGIFHSHNRIFRRLLWFIKFLDFNIKTGTPTSQSTTFCTVVQAAPSSHDSSRQQQQRADTMKYNYSHNISASTNRRHFMSSDSLFSNEIYSDFSYNLQEPCSSGKNTDLFATPMVHRRFTSMSTVDSSPKSSTKFVPTESVAEFFGLNDYGDIIINIDHIEEEKGFGFMMRRKKEVYRNVKYGEEISEKNIFSIGSSVRRFFKEISDSFCKCCRGEFDC